MSIEQHLFKSAFTHALQECRRTPKDLKDRTAYAEILGCVTFYLLNELQKSSFSPEEVQSIHESLQQELKAE